MRSILVSLPVRNVRVSTAFFTELGFTFSPELSGPDSACMVIDQNVCVLLVAEDGFRDRVSGDMSPALPAGETLISLTAGSEQEVDELVMRAVVAGGRPWAVVEERPVYSGSFQDPDGHLWQVVCPREPAHQRTAMTTPRIAA